MYSQFEETAIAHCAATLAGHKLGSLFTYKRAAEEPLEAYTAMLRSELTHKGLEALLLKAGPDAGLVYVYRPDKLAKVLQDPDVRTFLSAYGYAGLNPAQSLDHLSQRIHCSQEFPHEIGVFLGYPLVDVEGFIRHQGEHFCCLGCWKAYADAEGASRRFALYHKCRKVYLACYRRGITLSRLTVAA